MLLFPSRWSRLAAVVLTLALLYGMAIGEYGSGWQAAYFTYMFENHISQVFSGFASLRGRLDSQMLTSGVGQGIREGADVPLTIP